MTIYAMDPADLSADERNNEPHVLPAAPVKICATCTTEDGALNVEFLDGESACFFGCGRKVDTDTMYCGHCGAHSANMVECQDCGTEYEQWNGSWQRVPR